MLSTADIFRLLKPFIETVVTDDMDGVQGKVAFTKYMNVDTMDDAYVDDTEIAGTRLLAEKSEGAEMQLDHVKMGNLKRYTARTYALKVVLTKEAQEDNKYMEAIPVARMLKKSAWVTADVFSALILARATNTSYLGGDSQPLASASHTMPHGGTFSNTMATPMSPSVAALMQVRSALSQMPGVNGIISPVMAEKVVFPIVQQSIWDILLGSEKSPEAGNFTAINVAYQMGLEKVPVHHWTNTTTEWGVVTDQDDGLKFKWRKKPEGSTWMDNDNTTIKFGIRARWDGGWTNARGYYHVAA